jgi:hypothetical protein
MPTSSLRLGALALSVLLAPMQSKVTPPEHIRGCGYISDEGGCLHLVVPGYGSYQTDHTGSAGDTLFVWGFTDPSHELSCPEADAWLDAAFTGPCGLVDYGCGILVDCGEDPGQCTCLATGDHGLVNVLDLVGFSLGDTVRVTGNPLCCYLGWCVFDEVTCVEQAIACDSLTPTARPTWSRLKGLFRGGQ